MGRHNKLDGGVDWLESETDPAGTAVVPAQAARARRMAWIGRTPLMPVLAGMAAVGVVAAAFSTQQISLNFSNSPGDSGCVGCPSAAEATAPERPSAKAVTRVVRVGRWTFRPSAAVAGGFTGSVVVANTGTKPLAAWKLRFRIPNAVVTGARGATLRTAGRKGGDVYFVGGTAIAPGKRVVIRFTARGAWSKPTFCRINGSACG
ncbi:cellulose binding domain-containing protein [Actinocorallia longicatena]|uniref:CBM2 domain-containing protein n=1 Tax=Actinocorallia longicatena TaxID=111803 RepID=A0ABP6PZ12_9ACTN